MDSLQLTIQEALAAYSNNVLSQINAAALEQYGVDVLWFRAIPQKRSTDVLFQTYTLHNVEPCPLEMKAMYTDTSYDDAALVFSFNGIDYKPSLTLEFPIGTWNEVTKFDGSKPQKKDIVYIPITNKLWQVATMTPIMAAGGQVTSYKTMLETYVPQADRLVTGELEEAIENNTVSVDKLFGKSIEDVIEDLSDDKQLSNKSSTVKDKYKKATVTASDDASILHPKKVISTVSEQLIVDGHIVARSYYNMHIDAPIVVEYTNINDEVTSEDTRCLSLWVKMDEVNNRRKINSLSLKGSDKKYRFIELNVDTKDLAVGDDVVIKRGHIALAGVIDCIEDTVCVKVSTQIIKHVNNMIEGWEDLDEYELEKGSTVNLLGGESDNGKFSIDILSKTYVSVKIGSTEKVVPIDYDLEAGKWYGVIINLSDTLNVNVFESTPKLKLIANNTVKYPWDDNTFTRYYLKSSNSCMTNIRYYRIGNYDLDKQLEDLVSYNIKNNSLAVINDSADIYISNAYYGEQR